MTAAMVLINAIARYSPTWVDHLKWHALRMLEDPAGLAGTTM